MTAQARITPARWPEMMVKTVAAEYCGLSVATFEREYLSGRLPMPIEFGGKDRWRKAAIDKALDHLTGDGMMDDEPEYRKKLRQRYA